MKKAFQYVKAKRQTAKGQNNITSLDQAEIAEVDSTFIDLTHESYDLESPLAIPQQSESPTKKEKIAKKAQKLIKQKNDIIRLILQEMKNGGSADVHQLENAEQTQFNSLQNEKIRRYARFFRRFGKNHKNHKGKKQFKNKPKQVALQMLDCSLERSTELSEYESIMSEILDFSNFDDSPKRKLAVHKKNSSETTKDSPSNDEKEDDANSCEDADESSCENMELEPETIVSNLPVSSGGLRQIPNKNVFKKQSVIVVDKANAFEYVCKDNSQQQLAEELTPSTQPQSFIQEKEQQDISDEMNQKLAKLNITPGLLCSPQLNDSFVSMNCLSEVSNIQDPFKDDMQDDILQIGKEQAKMQAIQTKEHFNLLIDDDDASPSPHHSSPHQLEPSSAELFSPCSVDPKETSAAAKRPGTLSVVGPTLMKHVRTSETYEYAADEDEGESGEWAIRQEEDEELTGDGDGQFVQAEEEEEDDLAYKEVFYELINNTIVHNRQQLQGLQQWDLDSISERTNEDEQSSTSIDMSLSILSREELNKLYIKNIVMSK